ncbi:MAG: hypothetical protein ACR2KV_02835 [Solirubrobacteraceae bacterium]
MATFEELDRLSANELHDRAVDVAKHRLDVRFFWKLLEAIPEARAISGQVGGMEADVQHASSLLVDVLKTGDGKFAEALRPVYLEYLLEHDRPA